MNDGMHGRIVRWIFPAVVALSLTTTGCRTVGPDYQAPDLQPPESYAQAESAPEGDWVPPDNGWWTLFDDPILDELVDESWRFNSDVAIAFARMEEARALAGIERSALFPSVGAVSSASRTKFSGQGAVLPDGVDLEVDQVGLRLGFQWSLDLWGRVRRQNEAAGAELMATIHEFDAVFDMLAADVAGHWSWIHTLRRQLDIARRTRESRSEALELQEIRFEGGVISSLELAQARAELAATEATIPLLEQALVETEHRLAILFGENPHRITAIDGLGDGPSVPPAVPPGLPSSLLTRRPDVAAAEQRLIAANARIGVARAAYFPDLALTGYAGTESAELSDLFATGTSIWNVAASLVAPIFNAGRTRRGVEAAEARHLQALEIYRQTVRQAFADVENALVARRTSAVRREALGRQVDALGEALHLAQLRYEAGESNYLDVLDAQRNLFRAELELAAARQAEIDAAIRLFLALGGDWPNAEDLSADGGVEPTEAEVEAEAAALEAALAAVETEG